MPQSVLHKMQSKHGLDPVVTTGLPGLLSNCVSVFRSATEADSYVIKLGLIVSGEHYILPVKKEASPAFGLSYRVKSVYPKPSAIFELWTQHGLKLYPKKKEAKTSSGELSPL